MEKSPRKNQLLMPTGVPTLLASVIHERTGIFFEPERHDVLLDKITPLVEARGCASWLDYYYLLKYEENGTADWEQVMDALAVPETYFWREIAQVHTLVQTVVPEWFKRSSNPLRIWSAASSSGEEPYTLVIALLEAGWGSYPIEIRASDGSLTALNKARAGLYRENSFRALPPHLRDKYFTRVSTGWKLADEISRRVVFQRANLLAPEDIDSLAQSAVVFCRNVFIYFSPHAIRQTLAFFASRMPHGGYLFVGASESLLKLTTDFSLQEIGDAFVYVRI